MTDDAIVDLLGRTGTGPLWGIASSDLNATLLAWPSGHEVSEHVNAERDVLIVVLEGSGVLAVDGRQHDVSAGHALLIPMGASRAITAGDDGIRYLSVHRRRGPLQIETTP